MIEIVITFQLEHRFSKQQIFEMYANQINLGQRGSFAINGFGEASQAYFGKDVRQLDLAECALLAGMIQRPNYFNPYRHPDRAIERRNLVLDAWWRPEPSPRTRPSAPRQSHSTWPQPASMPARRRTSSTWCATSCCRSSASANSTLEGLRIYTSLDPDLQRAASAAVDSTMHEDRSRAGGQEARPAHTEKQKGEAICITIHRWRWLP